MNAYHGPGASAGRSADDRVPRSPAGRSELGFAACRPPWWRRWSSRCAAGTRPTRSSPPTSPGTLTCARCRTLTRCCSTGWCPTTSRRCCRFFTPRQSGWPARASARCTAVRAAFSSPIPTETASARSCVTDPSGRSTSSSSPTASGFWAWVTRASAAWASRSASCRCTRCLVASILRAPCRCSWMSAPITPNSSTTPCTSAGGITGRRRRLRRLCRPVRPGRARRAARCPAAMGGLRHPARPADPGALPRSAAQLQR